VSIGFWVGERAWLVGTPDFLFALFSTISARLEPAGWGSRFPLLMGPLYEGALPAAQAAGARAELAAVRAELAQLAPSAVVWDVEDRSKTPPWGDDIAPSITTLADYFVTSDGEDLLDVLDAALAGAGRDGQPLRVGSV